MVRRKTPTHPVNIRGDYKYALERWIQSGDSWYMSIDNAVRSAVEPTSKEPPDLVA